MLLLPLSLPLLPREINDVSLREYWSYGFNNYCFGGGTYPTKSHHAGHWLPL